MSKPPVQPDPWRDLKRYTPARIALGRAGLAIPTKDLLNFQLAHARARDAVQAELDLPALADRLCDALNIQTLLLHSRAAGRREYLLRPDLGRRLDEESRERLTGLHSSGCDVVFVVADGLSATAVMNQAEPFLRSVIPLVREAGWSMGPLVLAVQGRVALADEIGDLLRAGMSVILIGERPGLTCPTSMGVYFTYGPRPGLTDERRNCISNVHEAGLPAPDAARGLFYLMRRAMELRLSGVELKDETAFELPSGARRAIEPPDNKPPPDGF